MTHDPKTIYDLQRDSKRSIGIVIREARDYKAFDLDSYDIELLDGTQLNNIKERQLQTCTTIDELLFF